MKPQRGVMLIEVLVSLLIAAIALLGTVTLMARSSRSEMESYQRVQALTLVQDMAARINANRQVAACYSAGATGLTAGNGAGALPTCATGTPTPTATQAAAVATDLTEWNSALLGAAEVSGGNKIGAMLGAVGCVEQLDAVNNIYRISVAWQGLMPTVAPGQSLICGKGNFGTDNLRRVVSVQIRIAKLT